jgi:hypothetical protein
MFTELFLWFILQHCQRLDYVAMNGGITDKRRTGNDSERSGCSLIEVISRNLSGETEENYDNSQSR